MIIALFGLFFIIVVTLVIPPVRRVVLTGPIFRIAKKAAPKISSIERQAIEAGSDGFDAELFSGRPDWDAFRAIDGIILSAEEQAFLDGPTKELCALIDDWNIRGERKDVPDKVLDFIKKRGFLGLRVSKEFGGRAFSAQAQSIILGMVASRSIDASIIAEVPNSLGPDELIERYGTPEQKKYYLKRFVSGLEIPCFAITSPTAGSDVTAMDDLGYVTRRTYQGKRVMGVSVSWSKRYITLAPQATVIVLAFRLLDPELLLGKEEDRGITLALVPATHPGVKIGARHFPSGTAFPNGPIFGKDVFIPLDWIIGGETGIGQGWKMVMENLAAGRGISVPSMSVATTKFLLLVSTAYARVRRQFNKAIGKFEGVEEVLARIIEAAYVSEAARAVTASVMSSGKRPLVIASIMKYRITEYARRAVNDAMDIHGGKGVIDGPSNYLQSAYQMAPIAITVEGSNIITRSLVVIGQALFRSHPYLRKELEALESAGTTFGASLKQFDRALLRHVGLFITNFFALLGDNVTGGRFEKSGSGPKQTRPWYRALSHGSKRFAFLADIIIVLYQGRLKKKQKIAGRLADALSELYLLSCVLKRFEDDGAHTSDYPIVELCMHNGLARFERNLEFIIHNLHTWPLRLLLRSIVFPFGYTAHPAKDSVETAAVEPLLALTETRERLTRYTYIPSSVADPVGLLEEAFRQSVALEETLLKIDKAVRAGTLKKYKKSDWVRDALQNALITETEAQSLKELELLTTKVAAVDHFYPFDSKGVRTR